MSCTTEHTSTHPAGQNTVKLEASGEFGKTSCKAEKGSSVDRPSLERSWGLYRSEGGLPKTTGAFCDGYIYVNPLPTTRAVLTRTHSHERPSHKTIHTVPSARLRPVHTRTSLYSVQCTLHTSTLYIFCTWHTTHSFCGSRIVKGGTEFLQIGWQMNS